MIPHSLSLPEIAHQVAAFKGSSREACGLGIGGRDAAARPTVITPALCVVEMGNTRSDLPATIRADYAFLRGDAKRNDYRDRGIKVERLKSL